MKQLLIILLFTCGLSAKNMTPSDVYSLSIEIQQHMHFLLKYYALEHKHDEILKRGKIYSTQLKPRNIWQKTYEILVKINMQRKIHDLARIEPVGIEARLDLNPNMVYEMNMRILTELKILEIQNNIKVPAFKRQVFNNKTPLDNYNVFVDISASLDELNGIALTPSYVYAETMRIYDDITIILHALNVESPTTPDAIIPNALPKDALEASFELIEAIQQLQASVGIESIDFFEFKKENTTPSDVYTSTGFIIAELQTIKAYIGLTKSVTPAATAYRGKKPQNVEQLMRWNVKRLKLIEKLQRGVN